MTVPKNILFLTVGNRDAQQLFQAADSGITVRDRCKASLDKLKHYSIADALGYSEKRETDKDLQPLESICFPMLAKALLYLKDNRIQIIDHLFLICTDRSGIIPKLNEISEKWNLANDMKLYTSDLLLHAKNDKTADYAELLSESIKNGSVDSYGIKICHTDILKLGSYGFLDPLLNLTAKDKEGDKIIALADINILDFFEYELHKGLEKHFAALENNRLFLATYAGGMPLMQRALDYVLDTCLGYTKTIRIFNSEYRTYQLESHPRHEFLILMKNMTDNVLRLDWAAAKECFRQLNFNHQDCLNVKVRDALSGVFKQYDDLQKRNENEWYDRFCLLIFKALYANDWDSLVIWLKCMEEIALKTILMKNQKRFDYLVETVRINNQETTIIRFYKTGETKRCYLKDMSDVLNRDEVISHFKDYVDVFLDKNNFIQNKDWSEIRIIRNHLIHSGIPPSGNPKNGELMLKTIGLSIPILKDARKAIRDKNLESVTVIEQNSLNNRFFKPLRNIVGINTDKHILPERKLCGEYLKALHTS